MTREEEIHQAMKESVYETVYSSGYGFTPQATDLLECAFTKGAEWADKTMLDRACEWLAETISPEDIYESETNETPTTYLTVNLHDNMLDFITAFRQAMKGE